MQDGPLVSVVMPAYNAEKYISEAVLSILNQTYKNIELIVVDDKSTDNTLEILQDFDDSRFRLLINESNKGISYSTNKAIRDSKGIYIALMDDDDIALDNRIKLQVDYMEHYKEIDILGGACDDVDEGGNLIKRGGVPRSNPKYIKALLLFRCLDFRNGTTMIRKEFLDNNNIIYRDGYLGMQDYQFFIESSKVGNISSIGMPLIKYRKHNNNETMNQQSLNRDAREKLYSQMRRKSLKISGYIFDESQYRLIDKAFPEMPGETLSKEELCELYTIFDDLYAQAKRMKVDYLEELNYVLKRLFSEKVYEVDIFK